MGLLVAMLINAPPLRLRMDPTITLGQSICSIAMTPETVEKDARMVEARNMAPVIKASKPRIAADLISNQPPSLVAFHSPVRWA